MACGAYCGANAVRGMGLMELDERSFLHVSAMFPTKSTKS